MSHASIRRNYLLDALCFACEPITTRQALIAYQRSPWAHVNRGTARRDLRDLARRGHLIPLTASQPRGYRRSGVDQPRHPASGWRKELLRVIREEGGEWTTGRARAVAHRLVGTHVLRFSVRRELASLADRGVLDRHGDGTPRRYYTLRQEGAEA